MPSLQMAVQLALGRLASPDAIEATHPHRVIPGFGSICLCVWNWPIVFSESDEETIGSRLPRGLAALLEGCRTSRCIPGGAAIRSRSGGE